MLEIDKVQFVLEIKTRKNGRPLLLPELRRQEVGDGLKLTFSGVWGLPKRELRVRAYSDGSNNCLAEECSNVYDDVEHDLGNRSFEATYIELSAEQVKRIAEYFPYEKEQELAFRSAYERLAKLGKCDASGGMEYERVYDEWFSLGYPPDIDTFIATRANCGADGIGRERLN